MRTALHRILQPARQGACHRAAWVLTRSVASSVSRVYDFPRLYDVAFGDSCRDFRAETAFMIAAATEHAGVAPTSLLELACGPGRHARAAAHAGLRAYGLDASMTTLEYARAVQAAEDGGSVTFLSGDMRAARAALPGQQFSIVALLNGSLAHLLRSDDAAACLREVHGLLAPAGVAVIEVDHPRRLFDGTAAGAARGDSERGWEVPSWCAYGQGQQVEVLFGAPGDAFDPLSQVVYRTVTLRAWPGVGGEEQRGEAEMGDLGPPSQEVSEVVPSRYYTLPELELLARRAGLRVLRLAGGLGSTGADDADANSLVLVLCKMDET